MSRLSFLSLMSLMLWPSFAAADFAATLELLDSERFEVRRDASESLLTDPDLTLQDVALLHQQAKTPEQVHRIRAAALHLALTEIRISIPDDEPANQGQGSLGVVHAIEPILNRPDTSFDVMGIGEIEGQSIRVARIIRVLPGFPAYGRLRAGDHVYKVNGEIFDRRESRSAFELILRGYKPGEVITLAVVRDGSVMDVDVPLAHVSGLNTMYKSENVKLVSPFRSQAIAKLNSVGLTID